MMRLPGPNPLFLISCIFLIFGKVFASQGFSQKEYPPEASEKYYMAWMIDNQLAPGTAETAHIYRLQAAEVGHPEAQYECAVHFLSLKDATEGNKKRSLAWLNNVINVHHNYKAAFFLAEYYKKQEESLKKAGIYLNLAASKKVPEALLQMGLYHAGKDASYSLGVNPNLTEAFHYFRLAAQNGMSLAQTYLGQFYVDGYEVGLSPTEAENYIQTAAQSGEKEDLHTLGLFLTGQDQTWEEGITTLQKAYALGMSASGHALGKFFYKRQEMDKALPYLKVSADQGNSEANFLLGYHFLSHSEQDILGIFHLYQAALQGHKLASIALDSFLLRKLLMPSLPPSLTSSETVSSKEEVCEGSGVVSSVPEGSIPKKENPLEENPSVIPARKTPAPIVSQEEVFKEMKRLTTPQKEVYHPQKDVLRKAFKLYTELQQKAIQTITLEDLQKLSTLLIGPQGLPFITQELKKKGILFEYKDTTTFTHRSHARQQKSRSKKADENFVESMMDLFEKVIQENKLFEDLK